MKSASCQNEDEEEGDVVVLMTSVGIVLLEFEPAIASKQSMIEWAKAEKALSAPWKMGGLNNECSKNLDGDRLHNLWNYLNSQIGQSFQQGGQCWSI